MNLGLSNVLRFSRFNVSSISFALNQQKKYEQRRTIVNKNLLNLPDDYPEAWNYREKGYFWRHALVDRTMKRFHENSKLIVIEGNIGSDKGKIGREIADLLGFYYMPSFKLEETLIDCYGNDLRDYYHLFPKRFRIPDINMYYKNPHDDLTAVMQDRIYFCRHEQYMNALTHITNTGQGVILERSVYGDFVFANAMRAKNYIGVEFFKHYYYVRRRSLPPLLLYPHLVIYLDTPIDKCLENIKKRGNTDEINVCDEKYLQTISRSYKDLLKELKRHSQILAYDCSKPIDADTIVEDIEKLDFDFYEWHSGDVMETWFALRDEGHWTNFRHYITNKYYPRHRSFDKIRQHEVGELFINPSDAEHFIHVMQKEVLKSDKTYGFTHKDSRKGLGICDSTQILPKKWVEYLYRDLFYDSLHNMSALFDPYAYNYNPDYLHGHH